MSGHRLAPSWEGALRDLETEVARAEALLAGDVPAQSAQNAWTPPAGLGPVPSQLQPTALALLERQRTVALQLADAAGDSRRHDRALSHLTHDAPRPPVYIDAPA